ncbi:GLYCOGENIN SUBFAMILY MEMBER, partial [Salix viminalis]
MPDVPEEHRKILVSQGCIVKDFLNTFFRDVYKPVPSDYNLVLALLWRHPENINLEKVKVVHYCAA